MKGFPPDQKVASLSVSGKAALHQIIFQRVLDSELIQFNSSAFRNIEKYIFSILVRRLMRLESLYTAYET